MAVLAASLYCFKAMYRRNKYFASWYLNKQIELDFLFQLKEIFDDLTFFFFVVVHLGYPIGLSHEEINQLMC